jgi:hypothetical protein
MTQRIAIIQDRPDPARNRLCHAPVGEDDAGDPEGE